MRVDLAAIIVDVFSMICFAPSSRRVVPDKKLFTRARYFAKGLLYEEQPELVLAFTKAI